MKNLKDISIIIIFLAIGFNACAQKQNVEVHDSFKKIYDRYNVDGTFAMYDENNDKYTLYNQSQFTQPFIPASTFKICNSLIGLETGVIPDENFIIKWDSVVRQVPAWNMDNDMKSAFKNSTVWYYQELARRVGGKQMKYWLDKAGYGNADTSGGIDKFWLTGGLRISPKQQIDFLKRLHDNKLPFSQRSMDIVKNIMIADQTQDYTVRAKSGWSMQDNKDIGWYLGYLEKGDNVYYFANCIQTADPNNTNFAAARKDIVYEILDSLNLISNENKNGSEIKNENGNGNLEITHLTEDYYIFTTYKPYGGSLFPSNSMYLVTDAGVVLFDTPWDTTQFQPLLDSIERRHNKKVILCISTHFHADRTAGLEYYRSKGIKTFTSKQTLELCKANDEKQAEFYFTKDTTFTIGDHTFETYYPGEGHTEDNIVIWCGDEKILYGGCLVKSTESDNLGNIADANLKEWKTTINNLINKYPNAEYVIPGHLGWASNQGLQHTIRLLEQ